MNKLLFILCIVFMVSAYSSLGLLTDGLYSYFSFDDVLLYDSIRMTNATKSGTVNQNSTIFISGKSASFEGSEDYINLGSTFLNGNYNKNFTVVMWLHFDGFNSIYTNGFYTWQDNIGKVNMGYDKNTELLGLYVDGSFNREAWTQFSYDDAKLLNKWIMFVWVYKGVSGVWNSSNIYVNDTLKNQYAVYDADLNVDDNIGNRIGCSLTNAEHGNYQCFNGEIDEVAVWTRDLTNDEIVTLYNSGAGLPYPFITQSVSWEQYTPANGTHISSNNITFYYNISSNDNCSLLRDSVVLDSCYNCTANTQLDLFDSNTTEGLKEYMIYCLQGNSTIKYIVVDKTEPFMEYFQNKSQNRWFTDNVFVNCSDDNLYSCGFNITNPIGTVEHSEFITNISGNNQYVNELWNWTQDGVWKISFRASDDHNKLKSKEQINSVKGYSKKIVSNGFELDTKKQKIKVLSEEQSTANTYFDESSTNWHFDFDFGKNKKGETIKFIVTTDEKLFEVVNSKFKGHLISGDNYIDFEGVEGNIMLKRIDDYSYEVMITPSKDANKLSFKSIGELNINYIESFVDVCLENWTVYYGYSICYTNNTMYEFKLYTDSNNCGTNFNVPLDNGTLSNTLPCDYSTIDNLIDDSGVNSAVTFAVFIFVLLMFTLVILPKKWVTGDAKNIITGLVILMLILFGLMFTLNLFFHFIG